MEYFTPRIVKTTKIGHATSLTLSDDCESEIMIRKLKEVLNMLLLDQERYEAQFVAKEKQLYDAIEEKQRQIQNLVDANAELEGKIVVLENDREDQKRKILRMELKQKGIMTRLVASSRVTKEKIVIVKYLQEKIEQLTSSINPRMEYSCVDSILQQSKCNNPLIQAINFNRVRQKDNQLLESQFTINRLHATEIKTPVHKQKEEDTATQHDWVRTSIRINEVVKDEDSETKCPDIYRRELLTWRKVPRNQSPFRNLSKSSRGSGKSSNQEQVGLSFTQHPLRQSLGLVTQQLFDKHYFAESEE